MGTLERLQRSIFKYLLGMADLRCADIFAEAIDSSTASQSAKGLKIIVREPMPLKASKYAAGPTFSEVEVCVDISRDFRISSGAPSLLTMAEILSRSLHKWLPPMECGYGRITLSDNIPWSFSQDGQTKKISVKFKAQSVLQ